MRGPGAGLIMFYGPIRPGRRPLREWGIYSQEDNMNYLQEGQPGFWIPKPVAKKIEMLQADLDLANGEFRAIQKREATLKERVKELVEAVEASRQPDAFTVSVQTLKERSDRVGQALAAVEEVLK